MSKEYSDSSFVYQSADEKFGAWTASTFSYDILAPVPCRSVLVKASEINQTNVGIGTYADLNEWFELTPGSALKLPIKEMAAEVVFKSMDGTYVKVEYIPEY